MIRGIRQQVEPVLSYFIRILRLLCRLNLKLLLQSQWISKAHDDEDARVRPTLLARRVSKNFFSQGHFEPSFVIHNLLS